jgi:hypothetical protein
MQKLIASFLAQKKECSLPLIGKIRIIQGPAESRLTDFQIVKPEREVVFDPKDDYLSDEFIDYVSYKNHITKENAEEIVNNWCLNSKMKLDGGERINCKSFGWFQKGEDGYVKFFNRNELNLYEPVHSKKVVHELDPHAILVGDKETNSAEMNAYFEEKSREDHGKIMKLWVPLLIGIAILILILYFLGKSFSVSSIGNQVGIPLEEIPTQYSILS